MPKKIKEIVIGKEDAVFWLDKNGHWNNENGKFRHHKIIHYFHSCIQRDRQGYFLYQENENYVEKVYFPYEDQALFVFDVIEPDDVILVLNTKQRIKLNPCKLFVKNDCLYMHMGKEIIKFAEHGLVKIARYLEEKSGQLHIRVKDRSYKIPAIEDLSASG